MFCSKLFDMLYSGITALSYNMFYTNNIILNIGDSRAEGLACADPVERKLFGALV